jgi:shikimate dehydrogenase
MGAQTLTLFDVDAARAASLAAELQKRFPAATVSAGSSLNESLAAANGLIHATPTGMAKLPGLPLPVELLHRDLWVADIVYFPIRTALLQAAEALGCRTLSGGGMAVYQAVDAMRIFTGLEPDAERVYTHFQSLLRRPEESPVAGR